MNEIIPLRFLKEELDELDKEQKQRYQSRSLSDEQKSVMFKTMSYCKIDNFKLKTTENYHHYML